MIGIGIGVPRIRFVTAGGISAPPLLLDTYSGAAVSYSLRGLSTSYVNGPTPYACQVRNSSNVPLNIGFVFNSLTGEYELDVATLLAHCAGGNGFVDVWYTQSGNGFNATQINALSQPQIVNSGNFILENGTPAVKFDGIDDYLISSNTFTHNTKIVVCTKPLSTGLFWAAYDGVSSNYIGRPSGDPGSIYYFEGTQDFSFADNFQDGPNLFFADTTKKLYANNQLKISASAIEAKEYNTLYIGTRQQLNSYFNGNYQELIVYPTEQSTNRSDIQTNINNFYSIY